MIVVWMKNSLVKFESIFPNPLCFARNDNMIMLGVHLVLVTLHNWLAISVEQDKWNG